MHKIGGIYRVDRDNIITLYYGYKFEIELDLDTKRLLTLVNVQNYCLKGNRKYSIYSFVSDATLYNLLEPKTLSLFDKYFNLVEDI